MLGYATSLAKTLLNQGLAGLFTVEMMLAAGG
jgi:hypothetical protein